MSNKKLSLQDRLRTVPGTKSENALHPDPAINEYSLPSFIQESTTQQMYRIYKQKPLVELALCAEYYL